MNLRESDEWLMGQVRRGKRDALEKLVRRFASPLLTFIERMVGDRHRSEELFQEVFLRVWTRRKQYKLDRSFRAWLYAIAANRCRDEFRKRSTHEVTAPEIETTPTDDPSATQTAIATETATIVFTAVTLLPPQQRTIVVLRTWNGLSFGEIAEIVGTAESTVRSNMHRGLASMRRYLEPRVK
jgi:RNA polymerase sigma-70 factor (ECF subfamily)